MTFLNNRLRQPCRIGVRISYGEPVYEESCDVFKAIFNVFDEARVLGGIVFVACHAVMQ